MYEIVYWLPLYYTFLLHFFTLVQIKCFKLLLRNSVLRKKQKKINKK